MNTIEKYSWKIYLRNTIEKYSWEIPLRNTVNEYSWEIQLRNTADKYNWVIQLINTTEKYSWVGRGPCYTINVYIIAWFPNLVVSLIISYICSIMVISYKFSKWWKWWFHIVFKIERRECVSELQCNWLASFIASTSFFGFTDFTCFTGLFCLLILLVSFTLVVLVFHSLVLLISLV